MEERWDMVKPSSILGRASTALTRFDFLVAFSPCSSNRRVISSDLLKGTTSLFELEDGFSIV